VVLLTLIISCSIVPKKYTFNDGVTLNSSQFVILRTSNIYGPGFLCNYDQLAIDIWILKPGNCTITGEGVKYASPNQFVRIENENGDVILRRVYNVRGYKEIKIDLEPGYDYSISGYSFISMSIGSKEQYADWNFRVEKKNIH